MRDYSKVSCQFWTGKTGKALRGDMQAQVVAMYLMTSPHANMIGVFHCPAIYIAHETGSPIEGALKGLQTLIEGGFCTYDEETETVWVHEMAKYQIDDELKLGDKRVSGIQKLYDAMPESLIKQGFFERYQDAFHLSDKGGNAKPLASPLQAPTKPEAGTGTGTEDKKHTSSGDDVSQDSANASSAARCPSIPIEDVVALYHAALPELPAVRLMTDSRKREARKFCKWVFESKKSDGTPRASTVAEAKDWIQKYFERARENDFLMGKTPRAEAHKGWTPDFDFLLTEKGKKHVIEKTA